MSEYAFEIFEIEAKEQKGCLGLGYHVYRNTDIMDVMDIIAESCCVYKDGFSAIVGAISAISAISVIISKIGKIKSVEHKYDKDHYNYRYLSNIDDSFADEIREKYRQTLLREFLEKSLECFLLEVAEGFMHKPLRKFLEKSLEIVPQLPSSPEKYLKKSLEEEPLETYKKKSLECFLKKYHSIANF